MPGGDRTGPVGEGPMTGRAAGYCTGGVQPGFAGRFPGRFSRRSGFFGGFRGRRQRRYFSDYGLDPDFYRERRVPLSRKEQAEELKNQAEYLKENLDAVNLRIQELEKKEDSK